MDIKKVLKKHALWLANDEDGERANLRDADLSGVNLRGADLGGADLSGVNLRGADLGDADLSDADLSGASLGHADLSDADLSGASLGHACLRGARLRWADLSDANLRGANLRGANLREANLRGANLRGANLREADLREAKGLHLLPVQDARGYSFAHAIETTTGWRIRAGCRDFSIEQAKKHWGEGYEGNREQGDMYLYAIEWLEKKLAQQGGEE